MFFYQLIYIYIYIYIYKCTVLYCVYHIYVCDDSIFCRFDDTAWIVDQEPTQWCGNVSDVGTSLSRRLCLQQGSGEKDQSRSLGIWT